MRIITVILFLLNEGITGFAQSLSVGLSYDYVYAKQLDKSIQVYNFSRPFLKNKQPLLIHGISADLSYIFKNDKKIKHGINATYSYFTSKAINENYTNCFNLHFINLNYVTHFSNEEKFKKLFAEFHVGLSSSALFRRVNGDFYFEENEKSKSLGIGANLGVKIGYQLYSHKMHQVSPFIFFGYTPYLYAPKNEEVINATKDLFTKAYMYTLNVRIGFTYEISLFFARKNTNVLH